MSVLLVVFVKNKKTVLFDGLHLANLIYIKMTAVVYGFDYFENCDYFLK